MGRNRFRHENRTKASTHSLARRAVFVALGLLLGTLEISPTRRRRVSVGLFCAGTALVVGAFAWTALLPMDDPRLPPAPVAGQRFWELPTGSRIAYVRLPARGRARATPVVFLHGGPGLA